MAWSGSDSITKALDVSFEYKCSGIIMWMKLLCMRFRKEDYNWELGMYFSNARAKRFHG